MGRTSLREPHVRLTPRLLARRDEIETALLTRVYGIADPAAVGDSIYLDGFRSAVSAAFDFALDTLKPVRDVTQGVPPILLIQARLAARNGVSLDTVIRRYTAGHAVLVDFLIDEIGRDRVLSSTELRRLIGSTASAFDHLLAAVSQEHASEAKRWAALPLDRGQLGLVRQLLAGEALDSADLNYNLGSWHLGVVAVGSGAASSMREIAPRVQGTLLLVEPQETTVWAWIGMRGPDLSAVYRLISEILPNGISLALGEPSEGVAGWRLTHRQAKAALSIALRNDTVTCYSSVATLASLLQDDLLATSMRDIYLKPLERDRDGGATARKTLRAYFAADRNVSSAAAALGVARQTVANRLRSIEERLGRSLNGAAAEIELSLRLDALERNDSRLRASRLGGPRIADARN